MGSLYWSSSTKKKKKMLESIDPELIDTEILAAIDELKSKKAEGCDGIPAELLRL